MKHKLFIIIAITILIITCCLSIFGCKPTMLTVQFKTLGADAIADVTIKKGDTLTLPTDPTIQYRDFLGWYTDEKLTVAFDTQQKITSNITLYAKWKIAEHEHIYGGEYIENNCKKKKCIICGFVHEEKLPVGLQFVLQSDGNYTLDTAGILDNKNVVIPSSVDGRAVTKIARYAFKNSSSGIVSVTIPSSIKEIGDQAFMNCKTLTSVTLQNGASAPLVGDNVFKDCSALTSFNFGENSKLKTLPKNMFANCSALASITLPSSTTIIGEGVFDGCSKLASIDLTKITAIGASAFKGCSAFTSISIPNAVTTISFALFSECSSLTSVSIPSTVTIINAQAFNGCAKLQTITLPDSLTAIAQSTFQYCSSLSTIILPSSITSIGSNAFLNCSSLASVTMPTALTTIDTNAFFNCSSLASIIIPLSVTSIGGNAFKNCTTLKQINFDCLEANFAKITCGANWKDDKATCVFKSA